MSGPVFSNLGGQFGVIPVGALQILGVSGNAVLTTEEVEGSEVFSLYIGEKLTLPDTIFLGPVAPDIRKPAIQQPLRPPGTRLPT